MKKIILVLDNIRSRENVGSIFRTADAVGVAKIYLCGITPRPSQYQELSIKYHGQTDKIAKTALGAEKWVPWEYHRQTWRLIEQLKKDGCHIVALEKTKTAKDIFKFKPKFLPAGRQVQLALIVGNEVAGISPEILKRADNVVSIPMRGKKESLNVSVALGVAIYALIS